MKKKKALQKFDRKKSEEFKEFSVEETIGFLENFRLLAGANGRSGKSKLISIKIPEALLIAFKSKAEQQGRPYQRIIKELMWEWLSNK